MEPLGGGGTAFPTRPAVIFPPRSVPRYRCRAPSGCVVIFRTLSGSRYEVDAVNRRARRLPGAGTPTEMCADGWRAIDDWLIVGGHLLIQWDAPGKDFGRRATLTSPVVSLDGRPYP